MANKDDYLTYYREFFENFAQTVNPDDQLPVKLSSYKLMNVEVVGAIIDWTSQYLVQKKCPQQLIAPLVRIVIDEIRKACRKQPLECGFDPSVNVYEPLKLMQTVMAKVNEVCLRYLDNSMLCSLPSDNAYFATSVSAVRNGRRRMEDRHTVVHDLNTMFNIQEASPSSYYAIFDGHAGFHAASYSSTHLHQYLAESKHFIENPEQALIDAFLKTDSLFIDKWNSENRTGSFSSGTTAVVALLRPKEKSLYVAWVGDSQGLLVKQGKLLQIVNPHKPNRPDERERIEKEGGHVIKWGVWRVEGQLAVSRAIGDAEYKPFVTACPDVREIPLDGGEDFLILACDGLWDVVTEDCAATTVYRLLEENPENTDLISLHLVQLAKAQRSTDNISVIVVFLRDPSIIAEAHRAHRQRLDSEMETTDLDNANNPFSISNGATNDNVISEQKGGGLLKNLLDNSKQNGTDFFFYSEKSNGKRSASEFDEVDDFGPETNVDAVDDPLSPTAKKYEENLFKDEGFEGHFNPFMEHQEKAALETDKLKKEDDEYEQKQSHEVEEEIEGINKLCKETKEKDEFLTEFQQQLEETQRIAREETPTPPADAVHDVSGIVDNAAESESEDEWNYIKGEVANKENIPPQPEKEVAEIPEEDDSMSQLNPDAAEFVPVSPTRNMPSPLCRPLLKDEVISQSPNRAQQDIDINLPIQSEFEKEVKSRPSEVDSFNGHCEDLNKSSDLIGNLLNGKNIDDIPEFQPGSTPKKTPLTEEFHFGPNAVSFTPAKQMDQSEAGISTRALFGDESVATIDTSFNESGAPDVPAFNKEDPMSRSFYEDRDPNLFDLNKVQVIPDNIEEFLEQQEVSNTSFNETMSDLPEHHPLGESEKVEVERNNDDAIHVTDIDKQSYDDEKELASPLEPEKDLFVEEESEANKTPEPTHENLLGSEFCCEPKQDPFIENVLANNEEVVSSENDLERGFATEVNDLLKTETVNLPPDVEMVPDEIMISAAESNLPEANQLTFDNLSTDIVCERPASKSPGSFEAASPELKSPVSERLIESPERAVSESPVCERPLIESPVCERPLIESPVCERPLIESPVCEKPLSPSPVCDRPIAESPVGNRPVSVSPVCERPESQSSVCERPESKSSIEEAPIPDYALENLIASPVCEKPLSQSPLPVSNASFGQVDIPKSPVPNEFGALTPDFTSTQKIEEAERNFEELCHPQEKPESPQEDITSSVKDDISPSPDHLITQTQGDEQLLETNVAPSEVNNFLIDTSTIQSETNHSLLIEEKAEIHMSDLVNSTLPLESHGEEIDIKTDKISPEFAEQAIITPSEESKHEEIPSISIEEPAKVAEEEAFTSAGLAAAAGVSAVAAVAVATTAVPVTPDTKASDKKKTAPTSSSKKLAPKVGSASKPTTPKASPLSAPSSRLGTTKTTAPKVGAAKPPTSSLSSRSVSATAKPAAKPRLQNTTTTATKPSEKKPLANGEIKSTIKSTLTSKKESTITKTTTTKPLNSTKLSPTKPSPKTSPLVKPSAPKTSAPKPFTAKPAPASARPTSTTTAKRPTTLTTNRTVNSTSSVTAKPPVTKSSPKLPSAPKPKPATTTQALKPRVPLTKTVAKAPDTEKQNKESANKLTASKGTSVNKTSIGATKTMTSSTMRKVESKTSAASRTTVTKTTTTTMKSTTGKKPAELVRNVSSKTKTTKIEKPKENGESTIATEELIVVHTTNNSVTVEGEPDLIKDNSPLDNKLIIDPL